VGREPIPEARLVETDAGLQPEGDGWYIVNLADAVAMASAGAGHAWTFEGDCDPAQCTSNTYRVEWPPNSGSCASYPEVDRAEFFDLPNAREKINAGQIPFLDALQTFLK